MKHFLNWSGGKDSAFCLHYAKQNGFGVDALVTAVNGHHGRVSMHGVRVELIRSQAQSLAIPLHLLCLPESPSMPVYEQEISRLTQLMKNDGFNTAVFGDIFLQDLRRYREDLYGREQMDCVFPLWEMNTRNLMEAFINDGFKAVVVCVNGAMLDQSFCGRDIDAHFLADLPADIDPCGENGEYHSFVYDGPGFSFPVAFEKGEIVTRSYAAPAGEECFATPRPSVPFYFRELLPVNGNLPLRNADKF